MNNVFFFNRKIYNYPGSPGNVTNLLCSNPGDRSFHVGTRAGDLRILVTNRDSKCFLTTAISVNRVSNIIPVNDKSGSVTCSFHDSSLQGSKISFYYQEFELFSHILMVSILFRI
jgi:hypothetical protein